MSLKRKLERKQANSNKIVFTKEEYDRRVIAIKDEAIASACKNMLVVGTAIVMFQIGKIYRNKEERLNNWFKACTHLMQQSLEPTQEMIEADKMLAEKLSFWNKIY